MPVYKLLLLCAAGAKGPPSAASPLTHIKNLKIIIILEGFLRNIMWFLVSFTLIIPCKNP